jgi:NAD(P)H-dependent FMN reductase
MKIAKIVEGHYRTSEVPVELLSLVDLPAEVFRGEAYATKPPAMVQIQHRVLNALGLHIVTPEYNGSFPGVLKYFIDMLKFPESFQHKPVAFVGEAAGLWGGLRAVEQLQQIFGYRNAHSLPERVFIPGVGTKLDANGKLTDTAIDTLLANQCERFARFARHVTATPAVAHS